MKLISGNEVGRAVENSSLDSTEPRMTDLAAVCGSGERLQDGACIPKAAAGPLRVQEEGPPAAGCAALTFHGTPELAHLHYLKGLGFCSRTSCMRRLTSAAVAAAGPKLGLRLVAMQRWPGCCLSWANPGTVPAGAPSEITGFRSN